MTEDDAAAAGAKAGMGLYNACALAAELLTILTEPLRDTADRLTIRRMHREADHLTRQHPHRTSR